MKVTGKIRLYKNSSQTKYIYNQKQNEDMHVMSGEQIKSVVDFEYLGSYIPNTKNDINIFGKQLASHGVQ